MKNPESQEMYLETIFLLRRRGARARSIDVATELNISRPSVSNMVKILQNDGYLYVGEDGELILTEKGLAKATDTYDRHCVLTKLLTSMGADEKIAEENACRIEHVITPELFAILKEFVEKR